MRKWLDWPLALALLACEGSSWGKPPRAESEAPIAVPDAGLTAQWQLADLVGVGRIEDISNPQRHRIDRWKAGSAVSRVVQARIDRLYKGETASREIRFREYTDVDFAGVSYRDDTRSGGLQPGHSVMFFLKKREGDPAYRAVADYRGGYLMMQCAGQPLRRRRCCRRPARAIRQRPTIWIALMNGRPCSLCSSAWALCTTSRPRLMARRVSRCVGH